MFLCSSQYYTKQLKKIGLKPESLNPVAVPVLCPEHVFTGFSLVCWAGLSLSVVSASL